MIVLAMRDEDLPASLIQVALGERQGLVDPQTGAPQHDDQTVEPIAVAGRDRRGA
jgi:hypothetical protein